MFTFIKRLFISDHKSGSKGIDKDRGINDFENLTNIPSVYGGKYRVASCQSVGCERSHNEDTLFTLNCFLGGLEAPVAFGIYLVADGMGGHQSGELASNLAASGISQYLMDQVFDNYLFDRASYSESEMTQLVGDAVKEAQSLILRRVPGGGTTLTFVFALGDDLISAHVGDSRLYLIGRDGTMNLKTRDHSLVKRLVDLGEITESQAGSHPHRNVLYRALGQSDPFEPDLEIFSMGPGERLLLCSDGLWGVLGPQSMTQIMKQSEDLDQGAQLLVQSANEAGGPDNISAILVERLG